MKKILMTLATAFVAVSMNAQYYVGGTAGFTSNKDNSSFPSIERTTNTLTIAPEFGMALDDKMSVGIALSYESQSQEDKWTGVGADPVAKRLKPTTTTIALRPYVRYQLLTVGKFNVFADGGINFSIDKTSEAGFKPGTADTYDNKAGMNLGLFVQPGVSFKINDQWTLVTKFDDMFTLGYNKSQVADLTGAPDPDTDFNFGAKTNTLFQLGTLRFGVFYNF